MLSDPLPYVLNGMRKDPICLYQNITLSCIYLHPVIYALFAVHLSLCLIPSWCIGHIFAKAVTPDIKQFSTYYHIKKEGKNA